MFLRFQYSKTNNIPSLQSFEVAFSPVTPERFTQEFCHRMSIAEIKKPLKWEHFPAKVSQSCTRGPLFVLKQVDEQTTSTIKRLVQQTWNSKTIGKGRDAAGLARLGFQTLEVECVERIENLSVWERYANKRKYIQEGMLHVSRVSF